VQLHREAPLNHNLTRLQNCRGSPHLTIFKKKSPHLTDKWQAIPKEEATVKVIKVELKFLFSSGNERITQMEQEGL
jgi:hypothetical protein